MQPGVSEDNGEIISGIVGQWPMKLLKLFRAKIALPWNCSEIVAAT